LAERPVLALYNPEATTELHTDASMHGIGGIAPISKGWDAETDLLLQQANHDG
jgi:hypothetical protein